MGPFLVPNSQTVGTKTSKINPNLPFMVINLVFKFHRFLFTYTKVIVRKPRKMLIWAPFWPLIPKLLGPKLPKSIPTFLYMVINLVFKFHRFLFTYTKVIVRKPRKCLFGPFLAPNSQTVGISTPKINPNLPFVLINLVFKFQ